LTFFGALYFCPYLTGFITASDYRWIDLLVEQDVHNVTV